MEQLTLEQAASKYAPNSGIGLQSDFAIDKQKAFKAGAEWQKEQYKQKAAKLSTAIKDPSTHFLLKSIIDELLQD